MAANSGTTYYKVLNVNNEAFISTLCVYMLLWKDLVGKGTHIARNLYLLCCKLTIGARLTRRLHMHVQGKQSYRAAS